MTIEVFGSMRPRYSHELKNTIVSYLVDERNSKCIDAEYDERQVNTLLQLDNGIVIEQEICVRQSDCVCYTYLPVEKYYAERKKSVFYAVLTNSLNCLLDYGNFEAEIGVGRIRVRTYYKIDGGINIEEIRRMLNCPRHIINQYLEQFLEIEKKNEEDIKMD